MRMLSWVLLAAAAAILVGGLVVDATTSGESPNLAPVYVVAVALALVAMAVGMRQRDRG